MKAILPLPLAACWLASSVGGVHAGPVYGDASGDGQVAMSDAALLLRASAGLSPINPTMRRNGDIAPLNDYEAGSFGDGRIRLDDALRVLRFVRGYEPPQWPAVASFYLLEVDNVITYRAFDAAGTAQTGPGTGQADIPFTVQSQTTQNINGIHYEVFRLSSPVVERDLTLTTDAVNGRRGIAVIRSEYGDGSTEAYTPPKMLLEYPVQNETQWGPYPIHAEFDGLGLDLTYGGATTGPLTVTLPTGLTFDNAYRVTVTEAGSGYSNTTDLWVVPFVGLVMSGYTEVEEGRTETVMPQFAMVSANLHGVEWP